jgi:hypothetical protein
LHGSLSPNQEGLCLRIQDSALKPIQTTATDPEEVTSTKMNSTEVVIAKLPWGPLALIFWGSVLVCCFHGT